MPDQPDYTQLNVPAILHAAAEAQLYLKTLERLGTSHEDAIELTKAFIQSKGIERMEPIKIDLPPEPDDNAPWKG